MALPTLHWLYHTFQNPMFIHIDWSGNGMFSTLWSALYRGFLVLLFTFPFNWFSTTRLITIIINPATRIPRKYLFIQSILFSSAIKSFIRNTWAPRTWPIQFEPEPTHSIKWPYVGISDSESGASRILARLKTSSWSRVPCSVTETIDGVVPCNPRIAIASADD